MKHEILKLVLASWFFLFLTGCAGMSEVTIPPMPVSPEPTGVYHQVRPKETLWRISKMYGVDLATLAQANKLQDSKKILAGQVLFIPQETAADYSSLPKEQNFVWPVKGKIISHFGSPKAGVKNKGIDIKTRHGEPVIASRSGRISFIDDNLKGFGKTIIIDHDEDFSTVYSHNSQILVQLGQFVRQGTIIAKAGQSGRVSTPCLHFEIRKKHKPENPMYFLP